jgi:hypothetical protein
MIFEDSRNVIKALNTLRIGKITEEYDLQDKIADAFRTAGITFEKEYVLGPGNRVDFLTESGIAVEVKKGKPNRTRLHEQINRYAEFDNVRYIVIVVETCLRTPITSADNGKPCRVIGLQKLWGIAL